MLYGAFGGRPPKGLKGSPIELSCESELDVLVKVSISLESEFDAEIPFSVMFLKVSISLESELDPERASKIDAPVNLTKL